MLPARYDDDDDDIYIYIYIYIYGWLVGFNGISTFVGYLTENPFLS